MDNLCIAAPNLGAISETFIQKHMQKLLPKQTFVVARQSKKPYSGHWSVDCPILALDQLPKFSFYRIFNHLSYRLNLDLLEDLYLYPAVVKFLQAHKINIFMGEYLNYSLSFFKISQKLDIPFYVHAHGGDISVNLRSHKWRTKYLLYNDCAGIIVVSHTSRKRLIDIGISSEKVHVIPCGISVPDAPVKRNTDKQELICLAVGRMVPKKAPLLLLESFRLASEIFPHLRLFYIGDGSLMEEFKAFLNKHSLNGKVVIYGSQRSEFVVRKMIEADIFLQHSIVDSVSGDAEGLPVSLLEAMAHSLPVVSTRHEGIMDAVVENKTGFLVEEGDCKGMANHLISLAQSPELRIEMGTAGWLRAKEMFSWEREKEALLRLMRII